jgi:D-tyrosyl-tRNA(Tyr) deacylase
VVQRVRSASVRVEARVAGTVGPGLLVLLGVGRGDRARDAEYVADKLAHLRIFADEAGHMNRSVLETGGAVLLVSQFTLYGDTRKGRRPSFLEAAPPEEAEPLYRVVAERLRAAGLRVEEGVFRAAMDVELINEGPVTILIDSRPPGDVAPP